MKHAAYYSTYKTYRRRLVLRRMPASCFLFHHSLWYLWQKTNIHSDWTLIWDRSSYLGAKVRKTRKTIVDILKVPWMGFASHSDVEFSRNWQLPVSSHVFIDHGIVFHFDVKFSSEIIGEFSAFNLNFLTIKKVAQQPPANWKNTEVFLRVLPFDSVRVIFMCIISLVLENFSIFIVQG